MTERLTKEERLRRRTDYQRCYREGRRRHGSFVTLHCVPNSLEFPRLGITVTRKVGPAVVRNRLKRRIREIYRRWSQREYMPALDIVVHVKPAAAGIGFQELREELLGLWLGLLPKTDRT